MNIAFPKALVSFGPNSKVLLRSFKAGKCMMGIVAWNVASHLKLRSATFLNWGNLQNNDLRILSIQ